MHYLLLDVGGGRAFRKLPELSESKRILDVLLYLGSLLVHLAHVVDFSQLDGFADEGVNQILLLFAKLILLLCFLRRLTFIL